MLKSQERSLYSRPMSAFLPSCIVKVITWLIELVLVPHYQIHQGLPC
ncbi:MAG: hypothetical protein ACFCU7_10780 [Pleurocapsa sp.]